MANIAKVWNIPRQDSDIVDNYFKTIISYSHIMGSVTSILVDYIRSAFNEKYFKTIWNTLEVPYSQRSKSFRDIMNKPKPSIVIDPRFDPSDESRFRPQSEFDSWIANDPTDSYRIYSLDSQCLMAYNNFAFYYKPRRYKMSFSVHFAFDSDVQRIQCQEYIRQTIRHRSPIVGNRYIENILPDAYMQAIANINNLDYKSQEFLDYINRLSEVPITRRIRTGSGNIEFFAMQKTPIEILFTEGPSSNGPVTKNNITVSSSFSEDVTVEFVAYSLLMLKTSTKLGQPLYDDMTSYSNESQLKGSTTVGVDKLFTVEVPITEYLHNNCQRLQELTIQADEAGDDSVDLFNMCRSPYLAEFLHYYKTNGLTMDFIHVTVHEGVNMLDGARYSLNKKNLVLTIKDMDPYQTYKVNVYIDQTKLNEIKQKTFETDKINRLK